jgi:Uma2 family endonuclease
MRARLLSGRAKVGAMNDHATELLPISQTTQAAEGLPRRVWTVAEIEAMVAAGILDEHEHFELIGGEAVPMAPRSGRHELVKIELNQHLQRIAPDDLTIAQGTTLRLDAMCFLEPDFCVFPRSVFPGDRRGHHVLLGIEIGDASFAYDCGRKLSIYQTYGIPEVWVIDANSLVTYVFRNLGAKGYSAKLEIRPDQEVIATRAPAIMMWLAALRLKPL